MMPRVFETPDALLSAPGERLGPTDWLTLDQGRIDLFADATEDRQWLHVDPAKAAEGPFGTTIAHGFLTLALVNCFLPQLIEVRGIAMGVNVGMDRTRLPAPVRCGARLRASGEILDVKPAGGGIQSVVRVTIAIEGMETPALITDTISRYYPA